MKALHACACWNGMAKCVSACFKAETPVSKSETAVSRSEMSVSKSLIKKKPKVLSTQKNLWPKMCRLKNPINVLSDVHMCALLMCLFHRVTVHGDVTTHSQVRVIQMYLNGWMCFDVLDALPR